MKRLIFILVMILMFTACGETVSSQSASQPDDSMLSSENISLNITDYITKGAADLILDAEDVSSLEDGIRRISYSTVCNETDSNKTLADFGISLAAYNMKKVDNLNISYDVVFENADDSITVPMGARLEYYYGNREVDRQNIRMSCDMRKVTGNELIIIRHNNPLYGDILFYNAETLEPIKKNIDFSALADCFILDIEQTEKGYVIAYADRLNIGFAVTDDGGKLTLYSVQRGDDEHMLTLLNNVWSLCEKPINGAHMEYIASPRQDYVLYHTFYDGYVGFMFGLSDNKIYYVKDGPTAQNNNYFLNVLRRKDYTDKDIPQKLIAIRKYNDDVKDISVLDGHMGDIARNMDNIEELIKTEFITDDCSEVAFTHIECEQTLNVNLMDKTAVMQYNPTEKQLRYEISSTPNGEYTLWKGWGSGAGDISHSRVILKNNYTGEMKYIDTIGGMYGGSESAGFFSNGDVYTIGLDEFKVFTTDMSQEGPAFEMSKNFPLGSELTGDIYFRHLLAARRDPDNHSWVVLYNEAPYEEDANDWYMPGDFGDNFYKSTYKIGILDPQGNLTKVYDTGEHVMTYAFRTVEMYMKSGNIIHFSVLFKGTSPQLEAELDLNTGEYTCISGGYNEWAK